MPDPIDSQVREMIFTPFLLITDCNFLIMNIFHSITLLL